VNVSHVSGANQAKVISLSVENEYKSNTYEVRTPMPTLILQISLLGFGVVDPRRLAGHFSNRRGPNDADPDAFRETPHE
jgi:hypothetical protein